MGFCPRDVLSIGVLCYGIFSEKGFFPWSSMVSCPMLSYVLSYESCSMVICPRGGLSNAVYSCRCFVVLWGLAQEGFCPMWSCLGGVLSNGVFLIWGFVLEGFCHMEFCPRGVLS